MKIQKYINKVILINLKGLKKKLKTKKLENIRNWILCIYKWEDGSTK